MRMLIILLLTIVTIIANENNETQDSINVLAEVNKVISKMQKDCEDGIYPPLTEFKDNWEFELDSYNTLRSCNNPKFNKIKEEIHNSIYFKNFGKAVGIYDLEKVNQTYKELVKFTNKLIIKYQE